MPDAEFAVIFQEQGCKASDVIKAIARGALGRESSGGPAFDLFSRGPTSTKQNQDDAIWNQMAMMGANGLGSGLMGDRALYRHQAATLACLHVDNHSYRLYLACEWRGACDCREQAIGQ